MEPASGKQGRTPAYVYAFTRELPSYPDELKMEGDDKTGAFHSAELWYVFGTLKRSRRQFTAADYDLSERMVTYWTNLQKRQSKRRRYPGMEALRERRSAYSDSGCNGLRAFG